MKDMVGDIARVWGAIRLVGMGLTCWTLVVNGQPARTECTALPASDRFLGVDTFRLWEQEAPGARGSSPADIPTLTVFRPDEASANGTAVVVAPGGGYLGLASNHEGRQVADWFTSRGITAFVLKYRVGRQYLFPIQLSDAQRAIRLIRARAKEWFLSPDRIGIIGFSAGGHLAASAGTMFDRGDPNSPDPIERVSSRPDFIILAYAWLNAMKPSQEQAQSPYGSLLRLPPEKSKPLEQYTPALHASAETPPAFIYHASDDALVPAEASIEFYRALRAANVPAELHIFTWGGHGHGLGRVDAPLRWWPTLLEEWLRDRGLLAPDPALAEERAKVLDPPLSRKSGEPFSVKHPIGDLLTDPKSKAVLVKHLGQELVEGIPEPAYGFSLRQWSRSDPCTISPDKLAAIESDLAEIPVDR